LQKISAGIKNGNDITKPAVCTYFELFLEKNVKLYLYLGRASTIEEFLRKYGVGLRFSSWLLSYNNQRLRGASSNQNTSHKKRSASGQKFSALSHLGKVASG
jgi:hypothetical protein